MEVKTYEFELCKNEQAKICTGDSCGGCRERTVGDMAKVFIHGGQKYEVSEYELHQRATDYAQQHSVTYEKALVEVERAMKQEKEGEK